MRRLTIAALAMLLASAHIAAAQPTTPIAPGNGVLEGVITRGPIAPLSRPGVPNEAPVAEAQVQVADPSGKVVATAQSASDGSYSVALPPGSYVVSIASPKIRFGRHPSESVTITAGRRAHLDLQIDTGIR